MRWFFFISVLSWHLTQGVTSRPAKLKLPTSSCGFGLEQVPVRSTPQGRGEGGGGGKGTKRGETFVLRAWWMSAASSPFHQRSSILLLPIQPKVWRRLGGALPAGGTNRPRLFPRLFALPGAPSPLSVPLRLPQARRGPGAAAARGAETPLLGGRRRRRRKKKERRWGCSCSPATVRRWG